MNGIPLITSVAPSMSRKDEHGAEIGAAYQEACIRSWIAAGFRVISVNGPDDTVPFSELMDVVRTTRTAKEVHGKPVVFIADLFQAAARVTPGPVCIANADILLRPSFDIAGSVAGLHADQAIITRRRDVATLSPAEPGTVYEGFDLFAAHACVLAQIPDRAFAVGLHWWDSILPMELHARGVAMNLLPEPLSYHLIHDKTWNQREWVDLGLVYAQRLQELPPDPELAAHVAIARDVLRHRTRRDRLAPAVDLAKALHPDLGARAERAAQRHMLKSMRRLARDSSALVDRLFLADQAALNRSSGATVSA